MPTANAPAEAELSALHNAGMALLAEGRHDEAGLVFESVIDADPDADDSWAALGVCSEWRVRAVSVLSCVVRDADAASNTNTMKHRTQLSIL